MERMHQAAERGAILPLVLVFLALGLLLLTPTLGLGVASLAGTSATETKAKELYAADAGVEDALHWLLHGDPDDQRYVEAAAGVWQRSNMLSVNDAGVAVSFREVGDDILVTSVASTPASATTVDALIEVERAQGGGNVFENALTTLGGNVTMSGGAKITSDPPSDKAGDVYAAGFLNLSPSAYIEGTVYADSGITMGWSTAIDGDAYTPGAISQPTHSPDLISGQNNAGATSQDPLSLTSDELNGIVVSTIAATALVAIPPGQITRSGAWSIGHYPTPPAEYTGPEHVSGNMTINTGVSIVFRGSLHVDGDLTINSSGHTFTFEGPVIVGGKLNIQNGHGVFAESLRTGGDLVLSGSGNGTFRGRVHAGRDLDLGSGGGVSFESTIHVVRDIKASGGREIELGGDVYVGRHVSLTGSSKFVGGQTIVVIGNITLTGSTRIEDTEELPFLVSPTGNFSVSGSGYASAAVYAPSANVTLSGSASVYGAIVCNSISISGSAAIEYPVSLGERTDLPGGEAGTGTPVSLRIISYEIS